MAKKHRPMRRHLKQPSEPPPPLDLVRQPVRPEVPVVVPIAEIESAENEGMPVVGPEFRPLREVLAELESPEPTPELEWVGPEHANDREPNFRDENGKFQLVRCFVCRPGEGRGNLLPSIPRAICNWCGWRP